MFVRILMLFLDFTIRVEFQDFCLSESCANEATGQGLFYNSKNRSLSLCSLFLIQETQAKASLN